MGVILLTVLIVVNRSLHSVLPLFPTASIDTVSIVGKDEIWFVTFRVRFETVWTVHLKHHSIHFVLTISKVELNVVFPILFAERTWKRILGT